MQKKAEEKPKEQVLPVVSHRGIGGEMLEAIFDAVTTVSNLIYHSKGRESIEKSVVVDGVRYVPYSARNNLLTHRVLLLASGTADYGSVEHLAEELRAFIHRYVDVDAAFEEVAVHYVLLTWGYDVFNALPYLRVRGDYGSGKSRFLLTVGSLCYKPIFASGASTVSPIFRLIDQVGGTLIVDEADFWQSDERAEIIKILNNGNARGFPVLRSEVTPTKEFNPRAFDIYGPKVIATRHEFQDEALESRCLTQQLGKRSLRSDIPISLPRAFDSESQALRNKLLKYRFDRFANIDEPALDAELGLPPRRAQLLAPLLRVAVTPEARKRLIAFVAGEASAQQGAVQLAERRVVAVLRTMRRGEPAAFGLSEIARMFSERWGKDYGGMVSPKWIGAILRRLGLHSCKSNGVYVIPSTQYPQLYSILDRSTGDVGEDRDWNPGLSVDSSLLAEEVEGPLAESDRTSPTSPKSLTQ